MDETKFVSLSAFAYFAPPNIFMIDDTGNMMTLIIKKKIINNRVDLRYFIQFLIASFYGQYFRPDFCYIRVLILYLQVSRIPVGLGC